MPQPVLCWCCSSGFVQNSARLLCLLAGYARRGLRSAIAAAVKEGISVQEVMVAPPADAAAAAALAQLAEEMRQLDAKWATGKVGRASESHATQAFSAAL
jgi:hypothetical protein